MMFFQSSFGVVVAVFSTNNELGPNILSYSVFIVIDFWKLLRFFFVFLHRKLLFMLFYSFHWGEGADCDRARIDNAGAILSECEMHIVQMSLIIAHMNNRCVYNVNNNNKINNNKNTKIHRNSKFDKRHWKLCTFNRHSVLFRSVDGVCCAAAAVFHHSKVNCNGCQYRSGGHHRHSCTLHIRMHPTINIHYR